MRYLLIRIWLALPALCTLCGGCARHEAGEEAVGITILYTTDIHGQIFPYDFRRDIPQNESMAQMMTYIESVREENPEGTLLFDGGDLNQGTPAVYWSNHVAMRKPLLMAEVLNYMGYDAIVPGNHDIEAGEFVYADRMPRQAGCTILAANAIDTRSGEPMFEPYTIYHVKGYKVAVIGFITPSIYKWLPRSIWPHLTFTPMISAADTWMRRLREKENPDVIVGIFHAGHEDYPVLTDDSLRWDADGALTTARSIPGFDLVCLGHDHHTETDTIINCAGERVCVLQSAPFAGEMGRADILLTRRALNDSAKAEISLRRVPVRNMAPNRAFLSHFEPQRREVDAFLNRPLGHTRDSLYGSASLVGPSNLMDFVHQVQLEETDAQLSLASSLSIFTDIPAGALTMRQIFSMYKFENQIVKMWMSGEDVHRFLEYGYARQFNQMDSRNDHVLSFRLQADGSVTTDRFGPVLATPQYNFTSAAGINYTVDISKPPFHRVTIASLSDGTPFDPQQTYTVAINSYQAAGGGGFMSQGLGWTPQDIRFHTLNESTHDMCYYIAQKVRAEGTITTPAVSNWKVIPHDWWLANQQRDINIMLPYLNPTLANLH